MKGISTVIASILMLMIVIALAGTTYLYISGIFTGRTATAFEVIDSVNDTITIKNSGTESITSIKATLNGNPTNIAVVPNIQGLVAYWSFNDGIPSQTATDSSENKNHGALKPSCPDCPSWTTGQFSNGLQFDGLNDYVDVGSGSAWMSDTQGTIEAWIKPAPDSTGHQPIFTAGRVGDTYYQFKFAIEGDNRLRPYVVSTIELLDLTTPAGSIAADSWNHVVMTVDSSGNKVYINGVQQSVSYATGSASTSVWFNSVNNGARTNSIGAFGPQGSQYFNGTIDEVSIYNRALSPDEIKQLSSGIVSPGQLATVNPLTTLTKGTHTLRLCTSSMCNTAYLTIN